MIIGQAPPAVTQTVPYDTTLLYEMLSWVGISKEDAQNIFEFEAVSNKFPGFGPKGHLAPSKQDIDNHWKTTLNFKVDIADKILVLGNVAKYEIERLTSSDSMSLQYKKVVYMIHPSKRNHSAIFAGKEKIIEKLKTLL